MTSNCSSPCHYVEPCVSIFPSRNIGSSDKHRVRTSTPYRSSGTFRPLQQIYKTVYSPSSGNNSSPFTSACICRPAERYKTANMTYGSFHYNNWKFMQKNRPVNCVQSFKTAMNSSGICNSEVQKWESLNCSTEGQRIRSSLGSFSSQLIIDSLKWRSSLKVPTNPILSHHLELTLRCMSCNILPFSLVLVLDRIATSYANVNIGVNQQATPVVSMMPWTVLPRSYRTAATINATIISEGKASLPLPFLIQMSSW